MVLQVNGKNCGKYRWQYYKVGNIPLFQGLKRTMICDFSIGVLEDGTTTSIAYLK